MSATPELIQQARSTDPDLRQKAAWAVSHAEDERDYGLMFELLGDKDWRVRKTIVDGFVRDPQPEVVGGLLDALADSENAGKRNSSTEALVRVGAPAIPPIVERLRAEDDVDVRLSLVNLLGDLRNADGFDILVQLLETESDINVASSIVSSLGKYRDAAALPTLLRVLQREDLWLKFHAIEALGEIGDRAALPAILPLYAEKSLRKPVLEAIGKIADVGTVSFLLRIITDEEKLNLTALRALVRIADASKPKIVEQAERQLIQRKFRESFPQEKIAPLIEHLHSTPKRDVKSFILTFLGWSGDARVLPVLMNFLEQPDTAEVAAQALIDFGQGAVEAILTGLRNAEEDEIVALLLRVINVIGGAESIPSILPFLDHDNAMIRRLAIEILGDIADPRSLDYLLAKLDDSDVASQQAAVNSISALVAAFPSIKSDVLAKIRKLEASSASVPVKLNSLSVFVNIQGEGYHDELLLASKESDPTIRQKAVSLMGKFSEERFADQLVLSLADESTAVRLAAINAIVRLRPEKGLEPLISSLEDSDVWIRTAAAQALGEYRHPAAIDPLIRHLETDVPPVRIAAIEALGKSGDERVKEVLFRCVYEFDLEIRRAAILALGRIPGNEVFDYLMYAMTDSDWRVRAAAATAIALRGDTTALPSLHAALKDEDTYVQQSAVLALDKIPDRSSFPHLLEALENRAILDDVSDVFVKHKELYRDLLEEAWRVADSRREVVIAAILSAMKQ
jgi:HEAT repeat protein